MNFQKEYKYPVFATVLLIVMFFILMGVMALTFTTIGLYAIPLALFFGALFLVILSTRFSKTILTDESISTSNLLGGKTLKWSEINRVSGSGYRIKLQNFDGDVTVAPAAHLPGYIEVIEFIGSKRPDLFNTAENDTFSRNWFRSLLMVFLGIIFLGVGVYLYFDADSGETLMPILFIGFTIFVLFVSIFLSILSVSVEGRTLTLRYLLSQKTYNASDIKNMGMTVVQTRNGKSYYIAIITADNRNIRFSGLRPSLPIVYLTLKNWWKKQ